MRVAVLGAGYAGLTLARKLEDSLPDEADLVVVDESESHVVQHELHRVVRRPSVAEEITLPLSDVLDCEIRQARVTDVDAQAGVATLDGSTELRYDVGAICLGAETNFYDLPGLEEHGMPLKRLSHARAIRERYLDVLESEGRVVIGGAGLSGIQVAGELAEFSEASEMRTGAERHVSSEDDRRESSKKVSGDEGIANSEAEQSEASENTNGDPEILLLEQFDSVAPGFPANFQQAVRDELVDRGVDVQTNTAVEAADDDVLTLSTGEELAYDQLIWTGGIRGGAALDDERPLVRSDLRLEGDTFVVGDAGKVVDANGTAVPASAQSAIREARVAASNVTAVVEHRLNGTGGFEPRLDRYTFDSPGWLVSVGDGAVAQVGSSVFTGTAALALKTSVGAGYLGGVGAIENAVDLVQDELGLAIAEEASDGEPASDSDV